MSKLLELRGVSLSFGTKKVLKRLSFSVEEGEVVCLLGESGSGKTTILNSIQGLLDLNHGKILFNNERIHGPSEVLVPGTEGVATAYQDFRLQEGLTVRNNLQHELIHLSVKEQNSLCKKALDDCQLKAIKNHFPREISGGQRQKLALAKALVNQPDLILLDEPFSNLDNISKNSFKDIINALKLQGLSFLYVTHDVLDAVTFADRVVVLKEGRVEKNVRACELYQSIDSRYLARLLGVRNVVKGKILNELFSTELHSETTFIIPTSALNLGKIKGVPFTILKYLSLGDVIEYELAIKDVSFTIFRTSPIATGTSLLSLDDSKLKELNY